MRLLVSVRDAAEAAAALAGGADIVDAKEPLNGALGPVSPRTLLAIAAAVGGAAPISAALGEAGRDDIVGGARLAARAGVAFVKVGFAGMRRTRLTAQHAAAAVARVQPGGGVIVVAYADYEAADAPAPDQLVDLARRAGAAGILLDTYDKQSSGLTALLTACELRAFVGLAQAHGQIVALAGKLTAEDLAVVQDAGADIAGLRGAACNGGRNGVISAERVRVLRTQLNPNAIGSALRAG